MNKIETRCGDCKHYEQARSPETSRPLPSKPGICTYPVVWPDLPKSFLPGAGEVWGSIRRVQFPRRKEVWKDDREPCDTFEPGKTASKEAGQMALVAE